MPGANQLIFSPTDPNLVLLRVTFGAVVSRDSGKTWSWMCEAAIPHIPYEYDPMFGLTANGSLVGTVLVSLDVTPDLGCTWGSLACPITQLSFVDVAVRPDTPHSVLALSATPSTRFGTDAGVICPGTEIHAADGGIVYANQVLESVDDGAHWSLLGQKVDPVALVTTVDAAKSDPNRLYVSSFRDVIDADGGVTRKASLFTSLDRGQNWAEHDVPLGSVERAVYIATVDPTNADRVYVRTSGAPGNATRLLVTEDAGATFKPVLTLTGQMLGFALSQDGLKVYAGSLEDGLYMASLPGLTFEKRSSIAVACLAAHGNDLWACSNEKSGFLVGMSSDDGATFTSALHLCGIQSPIACPAGSFGSICTGAVFSDLPARLGCPTDAGSEDDAEAGAIADAAPSSDASVVRNGEAGPQSPSCGCSMRGGAGVAGFVLGGVVAVATAWRRRRSK